MNKDGRQLLAWVDEGRGQGHGAKYQPWLRISRRGQVANGNLSKPYIPVLGRDGDLMSANEANLAPWLLWLGASDLREQFPLWPHPHVHPIHGHPLADHCRLPWSSGTSVIARDLGIKHGTFRGTKIPYVATTDLMLTIIERGKPRLIAVAVKPASVVSGEIKLPRRNRERLVLEAAYAKELGIPWYLMSNEMVSPDLRENIDVAFGAQKLPDNIPQSVITDFCESAAELISGGEAIKVAIDQVTECLRLDADVAKGIFHHGLWTRRIPIDLREKLVMSRSAKLTDFSWAKREAVAIFGEHDHE